MVPRVFLLALIGIVPILDFVVLGYAYNWACDIARGTREALPDKIVTGKNFKTGFFIFFGVLLFGLAVALVCGVVLYLGSAATQAAAAFSIIVLIFFLIFAVFLLFATPFGILGIALFESSEKIFAFGEQVDLIKRKFGSLLLIILLPALLLTVAQFLCDLPIVIVWISQSGLSIPFTDFLYAFEFDREFADTFLRAYGANAAVMGSYIFFTAIQNILVVFEWLWIVRALGHYANRYASDWVAEANVKVWEVDSRIQKRVNEVRSEAEAKQHLKDEAAREAAAMQKKADNPAAQTPMRNGNTPTDTRPMP